MNLFESDRPVGTWAWVPLALFLLFFAVEPLNLRPGRYLLFAALGSLVLLLRTVKTPFRIEPWPAMGLLAVTLLPILGTGFAENPLEYSLVVMGGVVLGIVLAELPARQRESWLRWILPMLGIIVLIHVIPGLYRQVNELGWWGWYRVPTGGFRNPNVLARVVGMVGLGMLVYTGTHRGRIFRIVSGLVVLLILLAWIGSRGALLGFVVAALLFGWNRVPDRFRWETIFISGLIAAAAVVGLVGSLQHVTNLQRVQLIGESWEIFRENPLFGVGGWNFGLVYPSVSYNGLWQRHPHSLPLWIATEFGMAGIVFAGGVLAWLGKRFRGARFLPLVGFVLVHELVDTMLWIPGIFWLTVVILAPVFVGGTLSYQNNSLNRFRRLIMIPLVALVFMVVSGGLFWGNLQYNRGLDHEGEWSKAARAWAGHGTAWGRAHRALAAHRRGKFSEAFHQLSLVVRQNQYDPYYPWLLSELAEKRGRKEQAVRYQKMAEKRDPNGMVLEQTDPGHGDFPVDFSRTGQAQLRPGMIRIHPRQAGWYIPLVDRSLRNGRYRRALRQIALLFKYPVVSRSARIKLEKRRLTCYRMLGMDEKRKKTHQRLEQLRSTASDRSIRKTYHRLFYRRPGLDHGFFQ